tara:strand:- start:525 stop:809 length:285 start_codon:yes stop_codon:yes gene_type:complete
MSSLPNVNDCIKVKKITKTLLKKTESHYYCIQMKDMGETLAELNSLDEVNKFIDNMKKNNNFDILNIEIKVLTWIDANMFIQVKKNIPQIDKCE